jgi:hypothetical protein
MSNAMTQAFINAGIHPKGNIGRFYEGWNARLSYKTYQQLVAQGIMK